MLKKLLLVIGVIFLIVVVYMQGYKDGDRGTLLPYMNQEHITQPEPVRDGKTLGMGVEDFIKYFNNNSEFVKLKSTYEILDDGSISLYSNDPNFLLTCHGPENRIEVASVTFKKYDADSYSAGDEAIQATIFTLTPKAKNGDYRNIYQELDLYKDVSKSEGTRYFIYDGIYYYVDYTGNAIVFFAAAAPIGS